MLSKARFVLSRNTVFEKYNEVKAMADRVSYSYKTNFEVGRVLKETGSDFSVHSIESLEQLGCPDRVWFFAQGWTKDEIKLILRKRVKRFVVDNQKDLDLLLDFEDDIELLLRMRLQEHTIHTGKHFVYGFFSKEINDLLQRLSSKKNIKKLGIHFHRKTQNVSEWSLKSELMAAIDEENWQHIDYVNIGGGLPAVYKNYREGMLVPIKKKIAELREWLCSKNILMIIEPGRFIAAPSVRLEASIVNIYRKNIIIDCSVYNAAMDTFVANVRLLIEGELENGEAYTIKGCTPDSMDIFRYKVFLKKPKSGDKIVFLNAGAYTYTTDFCNLPKLKTIVH